MGLLAYELYSALVPAIKFSSIFLLLTEKVPKADEVYNLRYATVFTTIRQPFSS